MNKPYLKFGISVLALICIALGLYFVMNKNQTSSSNNKQATSTENIIEEKQSENNNVNDETKPKNPTLDLTKLQGKDRLYTEEEGKYENLSEEEKKLVENVSCVDDRISWLCGNSNDIKFVSLVSLYNGIAVISTPHTIRAVLYIYDIENHNILGRYSDYWNTSYGPLYIVREGKNNSALELYRPGMTSFVTIPNSELEDGLHYLEWKETVLGNFPVIFNGDIITVTIFEYDCDKSVVSEFSGMPVTCTNIIKGSRTFDLSNLP